MAKKLRGRTIWPLRKRLGDFGEKKITTVQERKKYNIELIVLCCTAQRIGIVLDHSRRVWEQILARTQSANRPPTPLSFIRLTGQPWNIFARHIEGVSGVSHQQSNGIKFNCQPLKKVKFYRQTSYMEINANRQRVLSLSLRTKLENSVPMLSKKTLRSLYITRLYFFSAYIWKYFEILKAPFKLKLGFSTRWPHPCTKSPQPLFMPFVVISWFYWF